MMGLTGFYRKSMLCYYVVTFKTNNADSGSYKKFPSAQVTPTAFDIAENSPPEMLNLPIYLIDG